MFDLSVTLLASLFSLRFLLNRMTVAVIGVTPVEKIAGIAIITSIIPAKEMAQKVCL